MKTKQTKPIGICNNVLLISVMLIIIYIVSQCINHKCWLANVALGLGTGGISSAVVAFLIEKVNRKKQQEEEKNGLFAC